MVDPIRAKQTLARLRGMGVRISIDDFGTGYSSLAYLRDLPVDEVKIDRSFVKHMDSCEKDASIVRSVIDLGHNLGLQVVAEGVEDQATIDLLPPAEFDTWIARTQRPAYHVEGRKAQI
jgi:diguanylate cyclase